MNWLPIESAPKDGRRILCWADGWDAIFLVWKLNKRINKSYYGNPCEDDDYEYVGSCPTHWLPLIFPNCPSSVNDAMRAYMVANRLG